MTSRRGWIALLLFAVLLFAAVHDHGHGGLWLAALAPILFVVGFIALQERIHEVRFAAVEGPSRLALPARAPPLS